MTEQELRNELSGKDVTEIAIEAWRDAEENSYQTKQNPYPKGTYAALEYTNACQKWWASQLKVANGN